MLLVIHKNRALKAVSRLPLEYRHANSPGTEENEIMSKIFIQTVRMMIFRFDDDDGSRRVGVNIFFVEKP